MKTGSREAAIVDDIRAWLQEIGKTPLLKADEEIRLAERIRSGDETAKKELTEANLRLVVSIAKKHLKPGLLLPDLIQHGNVGLMIAVKKFRLDKRCRFSTYATPQIEQSIRRAIEKEGRAIRVPSYLHTASRKISKAIGKEEMQNLPPEEIAARTGIKSKIVKRALECLKPILSLEYAEEDNSLGDSIANDVNVEEVVLKEFDEIQLSKFMEKLTPQERDIIERRFGLLGPKETLREIALSYRVTRGRIYQLQKRALKKLSQSMTPL